MIFSLNNVNIRDEFLLTGVTYFARDPLRSYFDECQEKNVFLNIAIEFLNLRSFRNTRSRIMFSKTIF